MIVKILKGSSSFSAIDYNEKRCREGEAVLLCKNNFPDPMTVSEQKKFLELWSSFSRTDKPQFHVTISAEGKDTSPEALKEIAIKWLNAMGYGENPYLIYFHSNTEHNHVHIVTSRIGRNGKKINDSFEKEKAVIVLDRIMNKKVPTSKELRNSISDCLRYSFHSRKMFQLLIERKGYKVEDSQEKQRLTIADKYGNSVPIRYELLDYCMKRYKRQLSKKEKRQMKAIIYKYAAALSKDDFVKHMKTKFGLDFVFFGNKKSDYGYSIIDHGSKIVHKGSDIMRIKDLEKLFAMKKNPAELLVIIRDLLDKDDFLATRELNNSIAKFGIEVCKGEVKNKISKETVARLGDRERKLLAYNNKLRFCAQMLPTTKGELDFLCRRYGIMRDDLEKMTSKLSEDNKMRIDEHSFREQVREIVYGATSGDLKKDLEKDAIEMKKIGDEYIFFSNDNGRVVSSIKLEIDEETLKDLIGLEERTMRDEMEGGIGYESEQDYIYNDFLDIIEDLTDIIYNGRIGTSSKKGKKKNNKVPK